MKLRMPLLSTALLLTLVSGSDAMGYYYGGGDLGGGTVVTAVTTVRGTLFATVGPNFSIVLKKKSGKIANQVKSGIWKVVVDDKSAIHNFHLTGPGNVNKATTVTQIAVVTWTNVTLVVGTYSFKCDPHATAMKGTFKVIAG